MEEALNGLVETIDSTDSFLLGAALRGAVLLALVGLLIFVLRRRVSAATRHLAWGLGLLGLFAVAIPIPKLWRIDLPQIDWPAPSAPPAPAVATRPLWHEAQAQTAQRLAAFAPIAEEPADPPLHSAAHVSVAAERSRPWKAILTALWVAGAIACLVPYGLSIAAASRLTRRARALSREDETRLRALCTDWTRVRLLHSEAVSVPMTWGWRNPVVLLPTAFASWPPRRQRAVLLHELAHVRRRDWLAQLAARIAVALHWFNPLAWLAERCMRNEAEHACDDAVLAVEGVGADYAESLVLVARSLCSRERGPTAAIPLIRPSLLERRVRAILDPSRPRASVGPNAKGLAMLATLFATVGLGGLELACAGTSAETPLVVQHDVATITVAPDGSADHRTIQAAVNAAPAGSLVRIAPGTYVERVTIEKPLTLQGAGWERTHLTTTRESALEGNGELAGKLELELKKAGSPQEQRSIRARHADEYGPWPALRIRSTTGVVVRDLQVSLTGAHLEGVVMPGAALEIDGAQARLAACAVTDSPSSGIVVAGASHVELRDCFVGGVAATGIAIGGNTDQGSPKAHVVDCELRNCIHRGITVGSGNRTTVIERCRISGSQWHGIRYDDAAPTITGNLIFDNARCGIYSSGETQAVVRGNLFHGNRMTGIACWLASKDTIEGNTFARDVRSAVEVLGAAKPILRRNIFFGTPQAVYLGNIGEDSDRAKTSGAVDLADNLFWQVESAVVLASPGPGGIPQKLDSAEKNGNAIADPGFVDPAQGNFALAPDSRARLAGIGAADPLAFGSAWQVQPAERRISQQAQAKDQVQADRKAVQTSYAIAKPWMEEILQIQDAGRRDAAVSKVREALHDGDPARRMAGLIAFVGTGDAVYDRASFREDILPLVESERGEAQVKAFYALLNSRRGPEDRGLLLAALQDPSPAMRESGSHLLFIAFDRQITGEAAEAALKLLASDKEDERREAMRGLWGATASDEVQARMLEIAAGPSRHDAIYFGLSTLQNKSRDTVRFLLDVLEDPDFNNSGRALWGLSYGVAEQEHELIADTLVQLFEARSSPRRDALRMLGTYGSAKHLPALQGFADNELLSAGLREQAREAIQAIQARDRK